MKYNININQKELSKYENLDLIDCAILDYIIIIANSRNEKIEKMRVDGYTWVDYQKIISDNPLLRIKSKGAITPRIKKLINAGFIVTKEKRKNGHKMLFFKLTSLIDSLFIQMNEPIHSDEKPIHENEPIIILSNYNTSNNITTNHQKVEKVKNNKNILFDYETSELLVEKIKENNPLYQRKEFLYNKDVWANNIRLMRTVDKLTEEEILMLVNFSQQDDFWKQNILSTAKLRKQAPKLILRAKKTVEERRVAVFKSIKNIWD